MNLLKTLFRKFFWVIFPALLLRACVLETVRITDNTMLPEVKPGDIGIIWKLNYGLRIPGTGAMIVEWNSVKKNDLVVLADIGNPPQTLLRRVIAVPGEKVKDPTQNKEIMLGVDDFWVLSEMLETAPDSRNFGVVPRRAILGKAKYIWLASERRVKSLQP